jgi:hypothetical protein
MMMTVSQAKIFLADQRDLHQSATLRRWSTSTAYPLYFLNEEILADGKKTCFSVEKNSYIIILPITGTLIYLDDSENETDINVEEAIVVYVKENDDITLINPFENDAINYLCVGIVAEEPMPNNPRFFNFDLSHQNQLHTISSPDLPFELSIGRFEERKEAVYQLKTHVEVFAFIITGVFEIEGRLLYEKDGLSLWSTETIELEALSNNAVVLTLAF